MTLPRWPALALSACLVALAACGRPEAPEDTKTPEPAPSAPADATPTPPRIDDHDDEPRAAGSARLEAHEHGHATLAVTVDGDQLSLAFRAPLISLGVTENPQTEADRAELNALRDVFASDDGIVAINAPAGCSPISTSSGTHIARGHGGLEADYLFTCSHIDKLQTVQFKRFGVYPGLASINAVFVSDTDQSVEILTASNPVFHVN